MLLLHVLNFGNFVPRDFVECAALSLYIRLIQKCKIYFLNIKQTKFKKEIEKEKEENGK